MKRKELTNDDDFKLKIQQLWSACFITGLLIGSVVNSEPGCIGLESRCGRHEVTQTVQNSGMITTEKYNRFAAHQSYIKKRNTMTIMTKLTCKTVNKTFL